VARSNRIPALRSSPPAVACSEDAAPTARSYAWATVPSAPRSRLVLRAFSLAASALLLVSVGGCRRTSAGDRVDAPELERELERIVSLQLVTANFLHRQVEVACVGNGDELHFKCHVDAKNPTERTQSWDELVTCSPPTGEDTYRCFTADGDALQ
jgi:hypothetical protein